MLRFDILWSRITLFEQGVPAQRLAQIPGGPARQLRLVQLLTLMDAELPGVLEGANADRLMALADEIVGITQTLAIEINQVETWGLATLRENLELDLWIMSGMAAIIALGAAVMVVLIIRITHIRRLRFITEAVKLLDIAAAPIVVTDGAGRVQRWNPAIMAATGIEAAQAHQVMLEELLDGPIAARRASDLLQSARIGERTAAAVLRFRSSDGARTDVQFGVSSLSDEAGRKIILLIGQDLSELERSRAQIYQFSHMATLGSVASNLAHELKQPINAIRLAAENALARLSIGSADTKFLQQKFERIGRLTGRTAAILEHIGHFNADTGAPPANLDLRHIVEVSLESVEDDLLSKGVDVQLDFGKGDVAVQGHAAQIVRVIVNLIGNARDALRSSDISDARIHIRTGCSDDGTSFVEVEDNGPGIPDEIKDKILQPFFTTKKGTQGTGLGLSITNDIIKAHRGSLEIISEPGKTVFQIQIPS
jgi:PAS domain S-box-containing protein